MISRLAGDVLTLRKAVVLTLCIACLGLFSSSARSADATTNGETELVFGGWGGTVGQVMKTEIVPLFEKRYNVKVVFLTQETVSMLARVKAQAAKPQIDVVAGTEASHFAGRKAGLFETLDPATFTNFPDLYPFARYADNVGVIFAIQALCLEYNTKVFQEKGWAPPSSWSDLWDPKYKGHVVVYNLPTGYTATFLGLLAVLNGGSPTDLEPAWAKLPGLVPQALAFVDPPAQLDTLFATGSGWIAFNGSGRIAGLAASGAPVGMVLPKEGAALNPNQLDIIKHAPHPTLAHLFVDFMLSPEAQEVIATKMLFGPVNRKVHLDAEAAAKVPYGSAVIDKLRVIDGAPIYENLAPLIQRWNAMIEQK